MKKLILLVVVAALMILLSVSAVFALHSSGGPLAFWPMEEGIGSTAGDTAHGNHGELSGGIDGNAVEFDGNGDYISIPGDLDIPGSFTVEAWINLDVLKPGGIHNIIAKEKSALPLDVNYNLHIYQNKVFLALTFDAAAAINSVVSGSAGCDPGGCFVIGSSSLSADTWYHVAGVYDDTTKSMAVYLNGSKDGEASFTTTGSPITNDEAVHFGMRHAFDGSTSMHGRIDDVRISSTALYSVNFTPTIPLDVLGSTLGLWHMDESVDATVFDAANSNAGTLMNDASWAGPIWNSSLSFDGIDDYVEVPDSALLDITGDISLQAWVNIVDFTSSSADKNLYIISKDAAGNRSYGIGVSARPESPPTGCGAPSGQARAFVIVFRPAPVIACGSTSVATGSDLHIAGTYDSTTGTATIYLDGVADGTVTVGPGSIATGSANVQIGAREYSTARGFLHASIDDPCIFTRSLSPVEIALFAGGLDCDQTATISLSPAVAFNPVESDHSITATISPTVEGIPIVFEVITGPNAGDSGSISTDGSGEADFTYTGDGGDGTDTISACIDLDQSGTCEPGEPTDSAEKTWFENYVTGGGKINFAEGNTNKAEWTFGGTVFFIESTGPSGQFQIVHHDGSALSCHFDTFTNLVFSGSETNSPPASHDTADFDAEGSCNDGSTPSIHVTIQDNAEPGKGFDTIKITGDFRIPDPTDGPLTIDGGNFQVHNIDS